MADPTSNRLLLGGGGLFVCVVCACLSIWATCKIVEFCWIVMSHRRPINSHKRITLRLQPSDSSGRLSNRVSSGLFNTMNLPAPNRDSACSRGTSPSVISPVVRGGNRPSVSTNTLFPRHSSSFNPSIPSPRPKSPINKNEVLCPWLFGYCFSDPSSFTLVVTCLTSLLMSMALIFDCAIWACLVHYKATGEPYSHFENDGENDTPIPYLMFCASLCIYLSYFWFFVVQFERLRSVFIRTKFALNSRHVQCFYTIIFVFLSSLILLVSPLHPLIHAVILFIAGMIFILSVLWLCYQFFTRTMKIASSVEDMNTSKRESKMVRTAVRLTVCVCVGICFILLDVSSSIVVMITCHNCRNVFNLRDFVFMADCVINSFLLMCSMKDGKQYYYRVFSCLDRVLLDYIVGGHNNAGQTSNENHSSDSKDDEDDDAKGDSNEQKSESMVIIETPVVMIDTPPNDQSDGGGVDGGLTVITLNEICTDSFIDGTNDDNDHEDETVNVGGNGLSPSTTISTSTQSSSSIVSTNTDQSSSDLKNDD